MGRHQYVLRSGRTPVDEKLMGDRIVQFLYSTAREQAPARFRALSSERLSHWVGYLNFDLPFSSVFWPGAS